MTHSKTRTATQRYYLFLTQHVNYTPYTLFETLLIIVFMCKKKLNKKRWREANLSNA